MSYKVTMLVSGLLWLILLLPTAAGAAVLSFFEGPEDGQSVAGIGIIRGWAFSDQPGVEIAEVRLVIDGADNVVIPCCSERRDVQAGNPGAPAENTLNSGFGITFNYGNLTPGAHTIGVRIRDSSGAQAASTHAVTVVRLGDFRFIDQVDLSSAAAVREGQDLLLSGVRIRDQNTQQVQIVDLRLRWFSSLQGLGVIGATTTGAAGLSAAVRRPAVIRPAQFKGTLSGIRAAVLESPENAGTSAGIAIIRGFTFAAAGRTISRVQLLIDGTLSVTIPCCSVRADVAAAFPNEPNALNSGFGLTFNYGNLSEGVHNIGVLIEDSSGDTVTLNSGTVTRRQGGFRFLQQLDFSTSAVHIASGELVVENAVARDNNSDQSATRNVRYRWSVPAQGFVLAEESVDDVTVTTTNCEINGDTSNPPALEANPGPDGISLAEALLAIGNNNTATASGRHLVDFTVNGMIACANGLPPVTKATTINGDINGDNIPDLILDGVPAGNQSLGLRPLQGGPGIGIEIASSDVILRGLQLRNFLDSAISIFVPPGSSTADIGVMGLKITAPAQADGIRVTAEAQPGQPARLERVTLGGNDIDGGDDGIGVFTEGVNNAVEGLMITNLTIRGNNITGTTIAGVNIGSSAQGAMLTKINIVDNTVGGTPFDGISVAGSFAGANNMVETSITDNTLTGSGGNGISVSGGSGEVTTNMLLAKIQGNVVQGYDKNIALASGVNGANNSMVDAVVENNILSNGVTGIAFSGGSVDSPNNTLLTEIRSNDVQQHDFAGIFGEGGGSMDSDNNMVDGVIEGNLVDGAFEVISLSGGFDGANGNMVMADIMDNDVGNGTLSGIATTGGWSASNNLVDTMIANNEVSNSVFGISIFAGTTMARANSRNSALNNAATGTIVGNTVESSFDTGIIGFGGFDDSGGEVSGNLVQQNIVNNTADGLICFENISGNDSNCQFANNTDTGQSTPSTQTEDAGKRLPQELARAPTIALARQLNAHAANTAAQEARLQALAEAVTDERLRLRLLDLCERLRGIRSRLNPGPTGG